MDNLCTGFTMELRVCHKLKFSNLFIFPTWCKPSLIHSLKYLRSTTLGYKDFRIRKSEFAAKTQFLLQVYSVYTIQYISIYYKIINQLGWIFWSYPINRLGVTSAWLCNHKIMYTVVLNKNEYLDFYLKFEIL